uniref:Uncharacterized protein n=1 Tax=Rhizophora mucronata TaxID=61149 RepID=A0A2P2MIA2_RHIMU
MPFPHCLFPCSCSLFILLFYMVISPSMRKKQEYKNVQSWSARANVLKTRSDRPVGPVKPETGP